MEDAKDEGVEAMRDGGQGDQGAADEGGEDFEKDLLVVVVVVVVSIYSVTV